MSGKVAPNRTRRRPQCKLPPRLKLRQKVPTCLRRRALGEVTPKLDHLPHSGACAQIRLWWQCLKILRSKGRDRADIPRRPSRRRSLPASRSRNLPPRCSSIRSFRRSDLPHRHQHRKSVDGGLGPPAVRRRRQRRRLRRPRHPTRRPRRRLPMVPQRHRRRRLFRRPPLPRLPRERMANLPPAGIQLAVAVGGLRGDLGTARVMAGVEGVVDRERSRCEVSRAACCGMTTRSASVLSRGSDTTSLSPVHIYIIYAMPDIAVYI
jgi:hypothetical protein